MAARRKLASKTLTAEVLGVFLGESFPFVRQVVYGKDGRNRAYRHTSSAINALHRVDKELVNALKLNGALHPTTACHVRPPQESQPAKYAPVSQLQLMRIKGEAWELFGPVLGTGEGK